MSKKKWNTIETRNGIEGRVCVDCQTFKSLEMFGRLKPTIPLGSCKICTSVYNSAYQKKNYIENRDVIRQKQAEKYKNYISRQRDEGRVAAAKYPPTLTCEICNDIPAANKKLVFDHNHITNEFRGWLCARCNIALGICRDNPDLLIKMSNYLTEKGNYAPLFQSDTPKKRAQPWELGRRRNSVPVSSVG